MKKFFLSIFLFIALSLSVSAQVVRSSVLQTATSAPSGACSPRGAVRIVAGTLYICSTTTDTWGAAGGGGSGNADDLITGTVAVARLPQMVGATSIVPGVSGIVIAPGAGDQGKFWRGDGTWAAPAASGVALSDLQAPTADTTIQMAGYKLLMRDTATAAWTGGVGIQRIFAGSGIYPLGLRGVSRGAWIETGSDTTADYPLILASGATSSANGTAVNAFDADGTAFFASTGLISFSSSGNALGGADTGMKRNAAGVMEINNGTGGTFRDIITRKALINNACVIQSGSSSPESAVTGNVCDVYLRTDGGASTTLYVKESGTGNTGWVAK